MLNAAAIRTAVAEFERTLPALLDEPTRLAVGCATWNYVLHQRERITSSLTAIVGGIYADYLVITAAIDPLHPEYEAAWIYICAEIERCLVPWRRRNSDALLVDEHAPDLESYADLKAHLHEFRFEARLRTYIQRVTQRAVQEWLRGQAAKKRGGWGFGNDEVQTVSPIHESKRWRVCYLSSTVNPENPLLLEDMLASQALPPDAAVEQLLLLRHIHQIVLSMTTDPAFPIIRQVWYSLMFEVPNVSELAMHYDMLPREMFNLKSRLKRRLMPLLRQWCV